MIFLCKFSLSLHQIDNSVFAPITNFDWIEKNVGDFY